MSFAGFVFTSVAFISATYGADSLVGDWKLDVSKSSVIVKAGRALIEPDSTGGYNQFSETVFNDGPPLRFTTHVTFEGVPDFTALEEHQFRHVSKRIDPNTFEISLRDRKAHV